MEEILKQCHSLECGGHFNGQRTTAKVLQSDFYWPSPFKDANLYAKSCDQCQRTVNIEKRNEMPSTTILEVSLMCGGLISWDSSHPLMGTYCWL